jgi:hypothetical protein
MRSGRPVCRSTGVAGRHAASKSKLRTSRTGLTAKKTALGKPCGRPMPVANAARWRRDSSVGVTGLGRKARNGWIRVRGPARSESGRPITGRFSVVSDDIRPAGSCAAVDQGARHGEATVCAEAALGPCTRGGVTAALRPMRGWRVVQVEASSARDVQCGRLREDRAAVDVGPRGARAVRLTAGMARRPCAASARGCVGPAQPAGNPE